LKVSEIMQRNNRETPVKPHDCLLKCQDKLELFIGVLFDQMGDNTNSDGTPLTRQVIRAKGSVPKVFFNREIIIVCCRSAQYYMIKEYERGVRVGRKFTKDAFTQFEPRTQPFRDQVFIHMIKRG